MTEVAGPAGSAIFPYHRGLAPMMSAFVALAMIELVVVHFLVALLWPWLAWPLTVLSGASVIWLIFWIRSFKRLPHRLENGSLHLYVGSLKHFEVPLDEVKAIDATWEPGAHKAKGAANLSLIAHPNRVIALRKPIGTRQRIFLRLDDPVAFDSALARLPSLPDRSLGNA